ncbi:PglL family O-oligosaccharyltransferase [Paraburkholderia silvatlantica]|uniref:O-antigen ligase n=1 Tax=Paraburkholderia silvatlantica TaxID=321895 RepID=A0ABR6FQH1_9BURK|nr:Wzy polymerase domain-containing protein [Paraburkholderia silvatlantica]MBB2929676.1 O-antigen ligase [Paraburkholderia silvatlantica]PVY35025.1 O-antigen ligase [Paraburkholderia silvatlantica]PXW39435.1 O-antigen ligase [Paraburkholderia silvatlantica]
MPSNFARYLTFVLLALALTLPYAVVSHTYPIPTFYAEFVALTLYVLMGAATLLLVRPARAGESFASPTVALVPLLFGLLLIVQTFALPLAEPSMNWLGAGYLLAAFLAAHAGYTITRARLMRSALVWGAFALQFGGLFAVFTQVIQLFHLETKVTPLVVAYNITVDRRPFGNMAQANHLATYIAFAMAGAMYLVLTRRLNVLLWGMLTAIYSGGLALTVSRGPWLQMGVIFVAGLWIALTGCRSEADEGRGALAQGLASAAGPGPGRQAGGVRAWIIPVVLVLIFFGMNTFVRWANVHYGLDLAQSAAERMKDASQIAPRLALWRYGWTMFKSHPVLGVGWGDFPVHQFELVRSLGGVEIANNAHDIFLDLLAKTGLVGLAIVVIGLVAWFVRGLRAPHTAERVFGFMLIGVLVMHALVEYPQQYMFFLLPAMFVFGLLETKPLRVVPSRVSLGVYAVVVFGGVAALYPVLRDYNRAEVLYYGQHPARDYGDDPSRLFGAWGDYGMATLLPMDAASLSSKLYAHQRAIALLPGETVLRRYAVLQALDGDTAGAFDTVERLRIFATELHDWQTQLASLYGLLDEQPTLAGFKAQLVKKYGTPAKSVEQDDEDDSDD